MANHLADQTSPYLLQHADNPVDWHPWSEQALALAREQNKPILLSIGYSACHWCHVMAHESFEDEETAALMNELFINIKVDREERPDLDKIYQTAHHILNQRGGGWPLTVFLRPDNHLPFFAGTYFPKEPRGGMIVFKELMQRVSEWYQKHPDELEQHSSQMVDIFKRMASDAQQGGLPDASVFDTARQQLAGAFDPHHGGFGSEPKFPHPTNIERLMHHWHHSNKAGAEDSEILHMVTFTMQQMALGGIYDQLGGGFCRYSVDEKWMIPHFEKMLYDNGPLLALYAQAFAATDNPLFQRITNETAEWVMREMQSPGGGYYSTLDADSEGEEGKFYVWCKEEVQQHLDEDEYQVFSRRFGLDQVPNFEGKYNPHVFHSVRQLSENTRLDPETVLARLASAREKLFNIREKRIRPGRDEKILTAWNGLMIKGMAIAARHIGNMDWLDSAERALEFTRNTLWQDGRLLATHKDGKTHLNAYLDDYAFMIDGILELLQVKWNTEHLNFACELADVLLEHFEDKGSGNTGGGFFFTSDDHESLIQRPKPFFDEAIPAGNGIAAYALQRLGHLVGNMDYVEAAENTLKAAATTIKEIPSNCNALLLALEETLNPATTLIIRGEGDELQDWLNQTSREYAPNRMVFAIPNDADGLPGVLSEKVGRETTTAYLCAGTVCSAPIDDLEDLKQQI